MKHLPYIFLICFLFSCSTSMQNREGDMSTAELDRIEMNEEIEMEAPFEEAGEKKEDSSQNAPKKPSKTWKRSQKVANTATLFIGDNDQLPLNGTQMAVKVDGNRARVLIDCFFYNDRDFQAEGTFKMKLPQGASPYYFAFGESVLLNKKGNVTSLPFTQKNELAFSPKDIEKMRSGDWSSPKVARVVPKEKAAFAYGQVVQRRVDPALAEWAGADVYNCRVYPLFPRKLHRIVIGYDVNLTSIENDQVFNFPIPNVDCPMIVDFDIAKINGVKCNISPSQTLDSDRKRKSFRIVNPEEEEISIRYQNLKNIAIQSSQNETKEDYFAASITPQLPSAPTSNNSNNALIALDISLSSNPDKFNVWLKMTEALLKNNRSAIKSFNVLLFNIESFWWKKATVPNTAENVNAFLDYAQKLSLEGASDINHALATLTNAQWAKNKANTIFLLSDGADTWGETDKYEIAKHIEKADRLFAFNTGMSGTSLKKLNYLTRVSGGAVFSVTGEDEIQKASQAFLSMPWEVERIEIQGTKDILIAGRPSFIYNNQKLLLTGRGTLGKNATVQLNVSQGSRKQQFSIPIQHLLASELATRTYGQIATEILEEFDYVTEKKSIAYAKHFGVPGKTCSLLMLETEQDYRQYNITATEDAFVVKSSTVNQIIRNVLNNIDEMLSSAKNKFKNWLKKLENMDGMNFTIPASLEIIVDNTPENKFSIRQKAMNCTVRTTDNVSNVLANTLKQPRLDYDEITLEAQKRLKEYGADDALKILSSLVEKNNGNAVLTRDVAYSALEWGLYDQAYFLLKRVLNSRPYEPQTYLAIAKSLVEAGNMELAIIYYEIAITAQFDARFGEFRRIAALDYLHILNKVKENTNSTIADYASARYTTLRKEFKEKDADLMAVISWNTDNSDIDLHVIEPTGEKCYYSNRKTRIGGYMTNDVTRGYGPEMYILENGKAGKYKVKVKYFSSDRNRSQTRTKIYATIYKNWGKKNEEVISKVVSLADNKQMHDIITVGLDK